MSYGKRESNPSELPHNAHEALFLHHIHDDRSVDTKDGFASFAGRNIEQENILYVDKEKSQALSVNPGIQFPDVMASLDCDIIIRKAVAFVKRLRKNFSKNA